VKGAYDVTVTRLPLRAVFDLRGPQPALADWCDGLPDFPAEPNRSTANDRMTLCHIGANRWLLLADLAAETPLLAALRPAEAPPHISIVRISDTLTFFAIAGPDAAEVMAMGCPMDLHPSVFGPDATSFTEVFGLRALVRRSDGGFDVAVDRSYADLIDDYLTRATA